MECGNVGDVVQILLSERQLSWFIKDDITYRCCRTNLLPYIEHFATVLELSLCLAKYVKYCCILDADKGIVYRKLTSMSVLYLNNRSIQQTQNCDLLIALEEG
jgi:hypothetical protein